jgi:hypothetical protein
MKQNKYCIPTKSSALSNLWRLTCLAPDCGRRRRPVLCGLSVASCALVPLACDVLITKMQCCLALCAFHSFRYARTTPTHNTAHLSNIRHEMKITSQRRSLWNAACLQAHADAARTMESSRNHCFMEY